MHDQVLHKWNDADNRYRNSPTVHFPQSIKAGKAGIQTSIFRADDDLYLDDFDRELLSEHSLRTLSYTRHELDGIPRARPGSDFNQDSVSTQTDRFSSTSSRTDPFSSPTVTAARRQSQVHPYSQFSRPTTLKPVREKSFQHSASTLQPSLQHNAIPRLNVQQQQQTPVIRGIPLVSTSQLPDQLRSLFYFPLFNAMQSKCFPCIYNTDDNLVVSAPTGSGKTVIMEIAICRLMESLRAGNIKVVYQAPTKSLCSERYQDWQARFGRLDIQCAELTGDTEFNSLRNVANASIIITTPEKWDSVTRKWKDNAKLMEMIRLFLVDEVHILKDSRGATLEAIVSRMKSVGSNVRFIALSATIPNSRDVATWLARSSDQLHLPAQRQVFDESFRPVRLQKHIKGYPGSSNVFAFENHLVDKVPNIVMQYSKGKPVMVFCATKESAARTANVLATAWQESSSSARPWATPETVINVEDDRLKKVVSFGVAYHHGGLSVADRHAIENAFRKGDISIICSTSTLAVGVNLPCYLVILKGTMGYTEAGMQEYSCLEVMQMLGRAGRPQYETEACAVIMCHNDRRQRYEKMVSGEEILESSLHHNLIEHLNAEIGIGTVHDKESAHRWLAGTFLNVRLQQNPDYYNLHGEAKSPVTDDTLQRLCEKDLKNLHELQLIKYVPKLSCTEFGDAMARYYVKYDTMKHFMAMSMNANLSEVLKVLVMAVEFKNFRLKAGEKSFLKDINKCKEVKYPINVDIALYQHKVSLLLQARLSGVNLEDLQNGKNGITRGQFRQLLTDTHGILGHSKRLIRCLIDIRLFKGDAMSAISALELGRGIAAGVWEDSPMQMKQIPGIGDMSVRRLAAVGIKSIDSLLVTEPPRFEVVLSKNAPFGTDLSRKIAKFPMLRISAKEMGRKYINGQGAQLQLRCEIGFVNESIPLRYNGRQYSVLFLAATSGGKIIDFRRFSPAKFQHSEEVLFTANFDYWTAQIRFHVMCDDLAGTHRCMTLEPALPKSWFPPEKQDEQSLQMQKDDQPMSEQHIVDDFDNGGLDDSDLIAAATFTNANNKVVDIDELLDAKKDDNKPIVPSKRKAQDVVTTKDGLSIETKAYHSPQQLSTGRWTCQHVCNQKGLVCKHKCCKEGVERPKKRPKGTTDSPTSSTKQDKLVTTRTDPAKGKTRQSSIVQQGSNALSYQTTSAALTKRPHHDHDKKRNDIASDLIGDLSVKMKAKVHGFGLGYRDQLSHDAINLASRCDVTTSISDTSSLQFGATDHKIGMESKPTPIANQPLTKVNTSQEIMDEFNFSDTELESLDQLVSKATSTSLDQNIELSSFSTNEESTVEVECATLTEPSSLKPFDTDQSVRDIKQETEEQLRKRLYEEGQKKKWEEIGSSIFTYEGWSDYIEIV